MNIQITNQCRNIVTSVELFKQACKMAATKADNTITKEEKKLLDKINKTSDNFIKDIQRLLN